MGTRLIEGSRRQRLEVLIAGGGVAALEAMLALRKLAADRVSIKLLAPDPEFVYRPLSVAEPFALGEPRRHGLAGIARAQGAHYRRDALAGVDSDRKLVRTASGTELSYGALLLAFGARRLQALPGTLTFRGSEDVEAFRDVLVALERREARRVAFAVPSEALWPLPIYELALLTAAHLAARGVDEAELEVVTHEPRPLGVFGRRASDRVRTLLGDAGVGLRTSTVPVHAEEDRLILEKGEPVLADRVVAMPRLEVPDIPGIPQGRRGFIPTDSEGRIEANDRVYAAGDATWFPLKQGGLAAQQADAAAAAIARVAGADVPPQPFRPVLRGALLTGSAPEYLRNEPDDSEGTSVAARRALWWPPSKIAGRYLAPYLAARGDDQAMAQLGDIEAPHREELEAVELDHREAVEIALTAADADARWHDYRAALRWLEVAEQLNLTLPPAFATKRRRWTRELAGEQRSGRKRISPS